MDVGPKRGGGGMVVIVGAKQMNSLIAALRNTTKTAINNPINLCRVCAARLPNGKQGARIMNPLLQAMIKESSN